MAFSVYPEKDQDLDIQGVNVFNLTFYSRYMLQASNIDMEGQIQDLDRILWYLWHHSASMRRKQGLVHAYNAGYFMRDASCKPTLPIGLVLKGKTLNGGRKCSQSSRCGYVDAYYWDRSEWEEGLLGDLPRKNQGNHRGERASHGSPPCPICMQPLFVVSEYFMLSVYVCLFGNFISCAQQKCQITDTHLLLLISICIRNCK